MLRKPLRLAAWPLIVAITLGGLLIWAFPSTAAPPDPANDSNLLFGQAFSTVELPPNADDREVRRSRQVTVNLQMLGQKGGDGDAKIVMFNLFSDRRYAAKVVSTEVLSDGALAWTGEIPSLDSGEIVVVVRDGQMTAEVRTPDGLFQIRPGVGEVHQLREIDPALLNESESDWIEPSAAAYIDDDVTADATSGNAIAADGVVVDVMVVYTAAARRSAGSAAAMESLIDAGFVASNNAFANSAVNLQLRKVHTLEVDYTSSKSGSTDLSRLARTDDGYLDEVHAVRDQYGADLVSLIVDPSDYCGIGYLPGAFSAISRGCSGGLVFAHELGHNLGAHHDWFVTDRQDSAKGYVDVEARWLTVMSYANRCSTAGFYCPRIGRFSNPDLTYEGRRTGVPIGTNLGCTVGNINNPPCDADNATRMNANALTAANRRPTADGGGGPTTTIGTPTTLPPTTIQPTTTTAGPTTVTSTTLRPTTTTTTTTVATTTTSKRRGQGRSRPCPAKSNGCR